MSAPAWLSWRTPQDAVDWLAEQVAHQRVAVPAQVSQGLTLEQLELRRTGVTATDITAIAGTNPYRKAIDVYRDKVEDPVERESFQTGLGERLEPVIAQHYIDLHQPEAVVSPGTIRHAEHEYCLSTPDRIVSWPERNRLLEIKNVGHRMVHHWDEMPPDYVYVQVQWQMACTGIHEADVAAFLGGRDYYETPDPYEFDESLFEELLKLAEDFWVNCVLAKVPPEADGSKGWADYILSRHPVDVREPKPATDEARKLAHELFRVKEQIKEAEGYKAECENRLKALIGSSVGLTDETFEITWKRIKSSGTDWKAVAMALGASEDLINQHKKPGYRRFLAKEKMR